MKKNEIYVNELIQETIHRFISPTAKVNNIDSTPVSMGMQSVDLYRHKVRIIDHNARKDISLISKKATITERRALCMLLSQSANVPFTWTKDLTEGRAYICTQDVDYLTDYNNLDIAMLQNKELHALAFIHHANLGKREQLSWLAPADQNHIYTMIHERWRAAWKVAKNNEQFMDEFGIYVPTVESVARSITDDMIRVLNDERTHTLIHNDLNPGNVLVYNNEDVMFIDWEEARYGSLLLDVPLRFTVEQAEDYRDALASLGHEIPHSLFIRQYKMAARYLGLRYMSWNLSVWTGDPNAKQGLKKYLNMVSQ
ncbi:phosphotransferase family protein [Paenibacillus tarimensis]